MKPTLTILFLLFLTLNAGAQTNREQTPSEWIKSLSTDMRTVELYRLDAAGVLHINRNAPMNLDSFLYFYSRYEKECTPEARLKILMQDSVWIPPINPKWREWLLMDLKGQPSFHGFIKWLRWQK